MFATINQHIIEFDAGEGRVLADFLIEHSFDPYSSEATLEQLVIESIRLCKVLPDRALKALLGFRAHSNEDGLLVLRGLPLDNRRIGPTPLHWSLEAQTKTSYDSEMYLMGTAALLGDVFAFSSQHQGNLIQNILPVPGDVYEQAGTSSKVFLDWHTEDSFHCLRADFVGLLCLRSHPSAATTLASVKHMNLPQRYIECLFEPRFRITCFDDTAKGLLFIDDGPAISVLYGSPDDPYVRYDIYCIKPNPGDAEAEEALAYFASQIASVAHQLVLQQGDLLFFDNHRVLHGRTAFTPRFDGTDRWLQRILITADLRKLRPARVNHLRVVEMNDRRFLS